MSNIFHKRVLSDIAITKISELWSQEEREILEFQQGTMNMTLENQIRHYFGHLYFRYDNLEDQLMAMATTIKDNYPLLLQIKNFDELAQKVADHRNFKKTNESTVKGGGIAGALNLKNINDFSETLSNAKKRNLTTSRSEDMTELEDELWDRDNEQLKNNIEINIKSLNVRKKMEEFVLDDDILENEKKLINFFNFSEVPSKVIKGNQSLVKTLEEEERALNEPEDEEEALRYAVPNPTGILTAMSGSKNRVYGLNSSETGSTSVTNRKHKTKGESWVEAGAAVKALRTRLPKLRFQYWSRLLIWFSQCPPRY